MMNKKGTFMWAVEQLENGKKVKRHNWNDLYFELDKSKGYGYDKIINNKTKDNDEMFHCIHSIRATDWEIYEEPKKTLAEIIPSTYWSDVKKSLKEFSNNAELNEYQEIILGEIFGKELIE